MLVLRGLVLRTGVQENAAVWRRAPGRNWGINPVLGLRDRTDLAGNNRCIRRRASLYSQLLGDAPFAASNSPSPTKGASGHQGKCVGGNAASS